MRFMLFSRNRVNASSSAPSAPPTASRFCIINRPLAMAMTARPSSAPNACVLLVHVFLMFGLKLVGAPAAVV
jgi:hypothetical protein